LGGVEGVGRRERERKSSIVNSDFGCCTYCQERGS
jgi:hypothetical protein